MLILSHRYLTMKEIKLNSQQTLFVQDGSSFKLFFLEVQ